MRPLPELMKELRELASRAVLAAIIVGFKGRIELVEYRPPDDGDPLGELQALISQGGHPIGMLAVAVVLGRGSVHIQPFQEFAGEDCIRKYLEETAKITLEAARAREWQAYQVKPDIN